MAEENSDNDSDKNKISHNNKTKPKIIKYLKKIIIMFLCSIIAAIEYKILLAPNIKNAIIILPGGIDGIATIIASIINSFFNFNYYNIFSITNNLLNIPSFFIAFRFFGFSFGMLTTFFVIMSNFLIKIIDFQFTDNFAMQLANIIEYNGVFYQTGGLLTRAILAAFCGALASSLIISINASGGGISTINYFLAVKKSKTIGYYSLITNSIISIIFAIFSFIKYNNFLNPLLSLSFAVIYLIIYSIVIDFISPQNKKEQIQVITSSENKLQEIIKMLPYGATVINSKGAHTQKNKSILLIIVSIYEVSETIELIKKIDPHSFIYIIRIKQAYGGFFLKNK